MSDDLISREALEAEFRHRANTIDKELGGDLFHISEIVMVIDNAPTVEQSYQAPKDYIKNKLDYSRPQGEWIIKSNGTTNYYACNKCGSAGDFQDNFCRVCGNMMKVGADMKVGIE